MNEIHTQLPSANSEENQHLKQNGKPLAITVSWAEDPKEYQRQYYQIHKSSWHQSYLNRRDSILARKKTPEGRKRNNVGCSKYRKAHRKKCNAIILHWKQTHRERSRRLNKESYERNKVLKGRVYLTPEQRKQKARNYERDRVKSDPCFRMARCIRSNIRWALKRQRVRKTCRTMQMLRCTLEQLKNHIESQFEPWMNWENYGRLWHIDHIVPIMKFRLEDPEEQSWSCFYLNLRPLERFANQSKSHKLPNPLPSWLPPHIAERITLRSTQPKRPHS